MASAYDRTANMNGMPTVGTTKHDGKKGSRKGSKKGSRKASRK